jgi:hypothetical protein
MGQEIMNQIWTVGEQMMLRDSIHDVRENCKRIFDEFFIFLHKIFTRRTGVPQNRRFLRK